MTRIWWILTRTLESLKNLYFHWLMFDLKKYKGVIYNDTEGWCKIWKKADLRFGKWHEEYGIFLPDHLKVSKLGLWWDPLIQSRKSMSSKFTEELCFMKMKNDAKFEDEMTCRLKIDMENLISFDPSPWKKIFILIRSFWAKYTLFEFKKVQRSYLSWHWRMIQNLVRNQLLLLKLTWGIWQIWTQTLESLKNFHFNGLFLSKVYIVWAKNGQRSSLSWHLRRAM